MKQEQDLNEIQEDIKLTAAQEEQMLGSGMEEHYNKKQAFISILGKVEEFILELKNLDRLSQEQYSVIIEYLVELDKSEKKRIVQGLTLAQEKENE